MKRKSSRFDRRRDTKRRRLRRLNAFQAVFETLEPRLLLFADPFFSAASASSAVDARLLIEDVGGVDRLRLIDAADNELASDALTDITGAVRIVGSDFDDTFRLEIDTATIQLELSNGIRFEAGTGSDRLVGPNASTTWNITAADGGDLDQSNVVEFTDIERLTGNDASDTFVFAADGELTGTIDGGDGINTLDYSAYTTGITVDLNTGDATGTEGIGFIDNVVGGSAADTITGNAFANRLTGNSGGGYPRGRRGRRHVCAR
jgi:hypothetical protein